MAWNIIEAVDDLPTEKGWYTFAGRDRELFVSAYYDPKDALTHFYARRYSHWQKVVGPAEAS